MAMPPLRCADEHRSEPSRVHAAEAVQLRRQLVKPIPTGPRPCLVARPRACAYLRTTPATAGFVSANAATDEHDTGAGSGLWRPPIRLARPSRTAQTRPTQLGPP